MTPKERFDCVFGSGGVSPELLVMPLIMTRAARHCKLRYIDYIRDPLLQAQAQFAICRDFDLDILATTSDPVSELAALGGSLVWFDDDPPAPDPLKPLLTDSSDLDRLKQPDPRGANRMGDRLIAIKEMKRLGEGRIPVLGWVEGPISEAAVMRGMTTLMEDLIDDPEFIHKLFSFNVDMAIAYAEAQVEAGADMIGFGDAPASLIGPVFYEEFVLSHEQRMIEGIKRLGVPVRMHICGNTTKILDLMAQSGSDMVDIDSVADFEAAARAFDPSIKLLGNLDPVREVLNSDPESIESRLDECHRIAGDRYIVGAGCEIPAKTTDDNLLAFSRYGHRLSAG
ncbi:MAG: uroporphyrinogen decarboxylase family protein [Fimbriimonas sp.]|nr:uroporphyrinogen decarboxylase family protein [Fimbriimonas sp.]